MTDFLDFADGGRALARVLRDQPPGTLVLGVVPNGIPGAVEVARALHLPLKGVEVNRDATGILDVRFPDLDGVQRVLVVDDAVESGAAARAIGDALRQATTAETVLAVPLCPCDELPSLQQLFDSVVAVVFPLERRSLAWHYDVVAPVPRDEAYAAIAAHADELASLADG